MPDGRSLAKGNDARQGRFVARQALLADFAARTAESSPRSSVGSREAVQIENCKMQIANCWSSCHNPTIAPQRGQFSICTLQFSILNALNRSSWLFRSLQRPRKLMPSCPSPETHQCSASAARASVTVEGVSRREVITVGSLRPPRHDPAELAQCGRGAGIKDARCSCILLWLDGGPSHFETFDPKPHTPDTVRGPYGVIPTSTTGVQFSELLPMLANWMDRSAIIRSMTHGVDAHAPVPMLTGFNGKATSYGAVVTRIKGPTADMPAYVHLGSKLAVGGGDLGSACDPIEVKDPTGNKVELPQFFVGQRISRPIGSSSARNC